MKEFCFSMTDEERVERDVSRKKIESSIIELLKGVTYEEAFFLLDSVTYELKNNSYQNILK